VAEETGLATGGTSASPATEQLGSRPSVSAVAAAGTGPCAAAALGGPPTPAVDEMTLRWLSWCRNGDLFFHESGRLCLREAAWERPDVSPTAVHLLKLSTRSRFSCADSSCEFRRVSLFVDRTLGLRSTSSVVVDLSSGKGPRKMGAEEGVTKIGLAEGETKDKFWRRVGLRIRLAPSRAGTMTKQTWLRAGSRTKSWVWIPRLPSLSISIPPLFHPLRPTHHHRLRRQRLDSRPAARC